MLQTAAITWLIKLWGDISKSFSVNCSFFIIFVIGCCDFVQIITVLSSTRYNFVCSSNLYHRAFKINLKGTLLLAIVAPPFADVFSTKGTFLPPRSPNIAYSRSICLVSPRIYIYIYIYITGYAQFHKNCYLASYNKSKLVSISITIMYLYCEEKLRTEKEITFKIIFSLWIFKYYFILNIVHTEHWKPASKLNIVYISEIYISQVLSHNTRNSCLNKNRNTTTITHRNILNVRQRVVLPYDIVPNKTTRSHFLTVFDNFRKWKNLGKIMFLSLSYLKCSRIT